MGNNTLNIITTPKVVEADDVNQLYTALVGDFFPRNVTSGAVEDDQHSLGSLAVQWKNLYLGNLFLNGTLFDPESAGTGLDTANAIVSGATRATSGQPDFVRADGTGASMTILATATPLQITANSVSVTISADIAVSSLTVAPSTNNTCLINDTSLTGGAETKYTGEHESDPITIDTVGSEITDRIGQYVCLKRSTEYMLAYVESATTLRHVYRGYFFDDSGDPIVRETISNNDTLTIMSLGWVFMDNDGVTVDVSYKSPTYSYTEPSSPDTDDYWFDLQNRVWKRYDGATFETADRVLIGLVVIDATNCVASRSMDFTKSFLDLIEMEVEYESATVARSKAGRNIISVYAQTSEYLAAPARWDITTDLESPLVEANSTLYYLYITEKGQSIISTERPYNRLADLKGWYHPYNSWRYVGVVYNNSSGDFSSANSHNSNELRVDYYLSSGEFLAIPNKSVKVTIGGGGGGGGTGGNGGNGGNSSFGSLLTTNGGTGGQQVTPGASGTLPGGAGGAANGGDVNINGQSGGDGYFSSSLTVSGRGGNSVLGDGGAGATSVNATSDNGVDGVGYCSGGSGQTPAGTSSTNGRGGGGAGGVSISFLETLVNRYAITIGGAGSGGSSFGGAGRPGICIIEYS